MKEEFLLVILKIIMERIQAQYFLFPNPLNIKKSIVNSIRTRGITNIKEAMLTIALDTIVALIKKMKSKKVSAKIIA
tara:strand:- start:377 stop:607 length:231 start_codon:yes stop_codon:yes gene_type:complete